jgi:hypothetical protein
LREISEKTIIRELFGKEEKLAHEVLIHKLSKEGFSDYLKS